MVIEPPRQPSPTGGAASPVGVDEAGVDEADERDEQADADRDRELQLDRDGVEDQAPQAGRGEQHDDEAVDDDEAHRLGPGDLSRPRDREERVDAEARGEARTAGA